ncbi:hypothetical protein Hanom_Chr07g00637601 [Helianthus anomalus]
MALSGLDLKELNLLLEYTHKHSKSTSPSTQRIIIIINHNDNIHHHRFSGSKRKRGREMGGYRCTLLFSEIGSAVVTSVIVFMFPEIGSGCRRRSPFSASLLLLSLSPPHATTSLHLTPAKPSTSAAAPAAAVVPHSLPLSLFFHCRRRTPPPSDGGSR